MPGMTDRDHFAAAALTGLLAQGDDGSFSEDSYARGAYRWADAMLRERERTTHDAAPAARASEATASPERVRVRGDAGTGDTPATHATHGEGSVRREGTEPVAWAVACDYGDYAVALFTDKASAQTEADRRALVGLRQGYVVVPLYRHPPCQDSSQKNLTLTDCERGAIERAVDSIASTMPYESQQGLADWKTLRGLLRRLGGGR